MTEQACCLPPGAVKVGLSRQLMIHWTYYRLLCGDRTVGYMREAPGRRQFWNGIGERWFREPIEYTDKIVLEIEPLGLRALKRCL